MFDKLKGMFTDTPSQKWANDNVSRFTPDWWNISQYRNQLYFAYGNDMPERREFDRLIGPEACRFGCGYTAKPMTLMSCDGGLEGSFPIALEEQLKYNSPHAPYTTLKGEILLVPTDRFRAPGGLDEYYANGRVFRRKRVDLLIPTIDRVRALYGISTAEGIGMTSAWMYVGIEEFWYERLDGGYEFRPAKTFDNIFVKQFYFYGSYDFSPDS